MNNVAVSIAPPRQPKVSIVLTPKQLTQLFGAFVACQVIALLSLVWLHKANVDQRVIDTSAYAKLVIELSDKHTTQLKALGVSVDRKPNSIDDLALTKAFDAVQTLPAAELKQTDWALAAAFIANVLLTTIGFLLVRQLQKKISVDQP